MPNVVSRALQGVLSFPGRVVKDAVLETKKFIGDVNAIVRDTAGGVIHGAFDAAANISARDAAGQIKPYARRMSYFLAREATSGAITGTKALGRTSIDTIKGLDSLLLRRTAPNIENLFTGRSIQPWLIAPLVVLAFTSGASMGEQLSGSIIAEPGQMPALSYDAVPNEIPRGIHGGPPGLNSEGIGFALHQNRHG